MGNDTVSGGAGNDRVHGGSGDDTVSGGDDDDRAGGGKGNDTVNGDAGNDSLFGGWGADTVNGGDGNDRLHALAADRQPDVLNCGAGQDVALIRFSERATTTTDGQCETIKLVKVITVDQQNGESADTDAQAN